MYYQFCWNKRVSTVSSPRHRGARKTDWHSTGMWKCWMKGARRAWLYSMQTVGRYDTLRTPCRPQLSVCLSVGNTHWVQHWTQHPVHVLWTISSIATRHGELHPPRSSDVTVWFFARQNVMRYSFEPRRSAHHFIYRCWGSLLAAVSIFRGENFINTFFENPIPTDYKSRILTYRRPSLYLEHWTRNQSFEPSYTSFIWSYFSSSY